MPVSRQEQQINDLHAHWHPEVNAWIVDMRANGTFFVLGAFQEMQRHPSFETLFEEIELDRAVESERRAQDRHDSPDNLDDLTARDLGLALWNDIRLDPGGQQQYSFYYAVTSSAEEALGVARQACEPMTADAWLDEM